MKYAWIENNKIRDICLGANPSDCYHSDIAKFYDTQVPDNACNGDGWVNGELVKQEPAQATPLPRTWSADDVRNGLTLAEKVKWDNDETATIKTAKVEFATPKELEQTTEILEMLVAVGDISQGSMDKILA